MTALRKGPIWGQCKLVSTGVNTRKVDILRKRELLHHRSLWCMPYLLAKFETRSPFLRLKRGPSNLTPRSRGWYTDKNRNVTRTIYRDVYGESGKGPTLSVFIAQWSHGKRSCGLSPQTTSAPSYNLCSRRTVFQYERFDSCSLTRCVRPGRTRFAHRDGDKANTCSFTHTPCL